MSRRLKHQISMVLVTAGLVLVGFGLGKVLFGVPCAEAMELPILAAVVDLDESLDYKRVAIQGWVQTAEILRTRRNDEYYTKLTVASPTGGVIEVVLNKIMIVGTTKDTCVVVTGVFRIGGRFAGLLRDGNFIIADTVFREFQKLDSCFFKGRGESNASR